jgi:hypothetical protein
MERREGTLEEERREVMNDNECELALWSERNTWRLNLAF